MTEPSAFREDLLEVLPEHLLDAWWNRMSHGEKFGIAMLLADLADGTPPDIEGLPLLHDVQPSEEQP